MVYRLSIIMLYIFLMVAKTDHFMLLDANIRHCLTHAEAVSNSDNRSVVVCNID